MLVNKLSRRAIICGVVAYLYLYIPLTILVLFSFNSSRLNVYWAGFSLKWYSLLFHDSLLIDAAINSLIIATISSLVAVILGTCAGLVLHKYKFPLLNILILIPIAAPELLLGVSLLLFFVLINFSLGLLSIMLGHITFCIAYVTLAIKTRLHGMDDSLIDAARDLGASSLQAFFKVLLPNITPGIIAGALMAFTISIDDFVITFFTTGTGSSTLPLAIYSMLKMGVTPEINAISTIIILLTALLSILAVKLSPQVFKQ